MARFTDKITTCKLKTIDYAVAPTNNILKRIAELPCDLHLFLGKTPWKHVQKVQCKYCTVIKIIRSLDTAELTTLPFVQACLLCVFVCVQTCRRLEG